MVPPVYIVAVAQKVAHPLHMAAWRSNINELQEQLSKPGADANKRDKVCTARHVVYFCMRFG